MINLVATRYEDDDAGSCCGCGRNCRVYYEIVGRDDYNEEDRKNAIFLCYRCFRPLMKMIETRGAVSGRISSGTEQR